MAYPGTGEAVFKTTEWIEHPVEPSRLLGSTTNMVRVRTQRRFQGSLEGVGVAEYVMSYHPVAPGATNPHYRTATYAGLMLFKGKYEGSEPGEAILITTGMYTLEQGAVARWTVDEQSTSGGLTGLRGTGGYGGKESELQASLQFKLEPEIEQA